MVAKSDTPKSPSPKGGEPQTAEAETMPAAVQGDVMRNTIAAVRWDGSSPGGALGGMLTVAVALNTAYGSFIVSGLVFRVMGSGAGRTTFGFTYSGPMSPAAIRDIVRAGAQILLSD